MIFLFLNQNICCGYVKESSHQDDSFEHPKHMLKLMGKKIFTVLRFKNCISKPMIIAETGFFHDLTSLTHCKLGNFVCCLVSC